MSEEKVEYKVGGPRNRITFGEYLTLKERAAQYTGRFLRLKREHVPIIVKCRKSFPLYLYMVTWITTDKTAKGIWKYLLPYYQAGHLPFCQNLCYIADNVFKVKYNALCNWILQLEEMGLIEKLGSQMIKSEHRNPATIWSLGDWYKIEDEVQSTIEWHLFLDKLAENEHI